MPFLSSCSSHSQLHLCQWRPPQPSCHFWCLLGWWSEYSCSCVLPVCSDRWWYCGISLCSGETMSSNPSSEYSYHPFTLPLLCHPLVLLLHHFLFYNHLFLLNLLKAYDSGFVNSIDANGGGGDAGNNTLSVVAYGVTRLSGISPLQGILVEMLLTFMLVMVFVNTTVGKPSEFKSTAPLLIGLTVVAGTLSG